MYPKIPLIYFIHLEQKSNLYIMYMRKSQFTIHMLSPNFSLAKCTYLFFLLPSLTTTTLSNKPRPFTYAECLLSYATFSAFFFTKKFILTYIHFLLRIFTYILPIGLSILGPFNQLPTTMKTMKNPHNIYFYCVIELLYKVEIKTI